MRESLSRSLYSAHLEDGVGERPIHRVASLRASTALGSALFRWKWAGDKRCRGVAFILTLAWASKTLRIAPHNPSFPLLKRAVKQALVEWHSPNCRACQGLGMIHVERHGGLVGVDHTCPTCGGAGAHRYSDLDRSQTLGLASIGKWTERIETIRRRLSAQEIGVSVGARRELER
jgi:hypothetical protein